MTISSPKPPAAQTARAKILESAIFLMRESGLTGAGINQVLEHSGAPKGSMYYYFPNGKVQLTREALELYISRVSDAFEATLSSKEDPAGKITALFRMVANRLQKSDFAQSCAVGAVALDIDDETDEIRPVLAMAMAAWRDVIARHLPMHNPAERESFAGLVLSAIEGGYVRGRAERSASALIEAGKWLAEVLNRTAATKLSRR